ncbi:MAG: AAA family ATPase, partial [Candidatus Thorarchaeota archaeon]
MKLVSVELENIRSYERGLARFPDGSVLLSGDIGCGKSTLLLATEFALFGIRRGELPGSSLLRRGKKRGLVRLVFSIDNKEIVVERTLKRTASSVAQDAGRIIIDGVVHDYTPMELKAHILNYLGYPPELLDLQKSLLFRYTVYTPQEHLKSIMWAKPDERLDSLRKAFGVERYRRIQENLDQFLISLRAKKRDLAIIHRDLDKKIRAKSALNGQLKTAKKKIEGLTRDVERVALELDEWKEKKAAIEEQVQLYNNLKVELAREIGNAERIEGQFNNAKDSADTIRSRIEEIDGLKSPTKKSDIELTELIKDADEKIIKCLTDPSGEDESID